MPSAPKQWGKKRETRVINRNVVERRNEYRKKDWRKLREEVLARDGHVCQSCGMIITEKGKAHVDHIDEITLPEEVVCDIEKLQTLCASCHSRKTLRSQKK